MRRGGILTKTIGHSQMVTGMLFCFILYTLSGCIPQYHPEKVGDGITFISLKDPLPIDSIVWSPADENEILVTAGEVGQGPAEVYILDLQSGKKKSLAKTKYGDFVRSMWSPDGNRIYIIVRENSMGYEPGGLWVVNVDTGSTSYYLDAGDAAWSPDGKTLALKTFEYTNANSKTIKIKLFDVNTKQEEEIFTNNSSGYFWGLSWSPSGEHLVFGLGQDEPGDLFIVDINTHRASNVTEGRKGSNPTWSPRGNVIAYEMWPPDGSRTTINLINSNGTCEVTIPNYEYVWSPTWSPDGRKLGFLSYDGIYLIEADQALAMMSMPTCIDDLH